MSMQARSFPGNLSWSVGTVATGLAAVDWIAALGLVPALLAWHAARMRRATIAPIAPFRGVRSILVLHGPLRAVRIGSSVSVQSTAPRTGVSTPATRPDSHLVGAIGVQASRSRQIHCWCALSAPDACGNARFTPRVNRM